MKCEKCNADFALKEQAKTKGCCPSCGEKLPASSYRDDAKAWRWYQYHSPMPLSVILAYIYLIGAGGLAGVMVLEAADLGLWKVTDPTGWLSVVAVALIFVLPLCVLFFTPSARGWRAKLRGDMLAYEAAVKSGKSALLKCKTCNSEFSLWKLAWKKGCCPSCGEKIPVSDYCSGVPDRRWWRLFRDAPLGLKLSAIVLFLFGCFAVFNSYLAPSLVMMTSFCCMFIYGIAIYVVLLLMFFLMVKAVVKGSIPYVCIMAVGVLGLCAALESFQKCLVVLLTLTLILLSFSLPASRRWARKIREEDLACWIAARSGALPFRRMVAKYILKKIVIGALLVVCLGTCAYTPESIGLMCDRLKDRYVELMSGGCR